LKLNAILYEIMSLFQGKSEEVFSLRSDEFVFIVLFGVSFPSVTIDKLETDRTEPISAGRVVTVIGAEAVNRSDVETKLKKLGITWNRSNVNLQVQNVHSLQIELVQLLTHPNE
jgi:hypothetical protein